MEHPGNGPDHGVNPSAARMVETNRAYDKELKQFDIYAALESSLKRQLLAAIRPIDVNSLNENLYGFALSSTFDILQHLRTTHGKITPDDLRKNPLELDHKWQPPEEIGSLFKQIKDCRRLATDGNDPITKKLSSGLPSRTSNQPVFSLRPVPSGERRTTQNLNSFAFCRPFH
jgi:hypothetical protein